MNTVESLFMDIQAFNVIMDTGVALSEEQMSKLNEKKEKLNKKYEEELKQFGFNAKTDIYQTSRGEWKTNKPRQKCIKDRDKLIAWVYEQYTSGWLDEPCCNPDATLMECFDGAMAQLNALVKKNKRSGETPLLYQQRFKKYFVEYPQNVDDPTYAGPPLATMPIAKLRAKKLKKYMEALATDFDFDSKAFRNAKTPLIMAFDYADTEDIVEGNIALSVTSRGIALRETSNTLVAYTREEIVKLLDVMTDEAVLSSYRSGSLAREAAAALCYETQVSTRACETRYLRACDVYIDSDTACVSIHGFIRRTRDANGKRKYVDRDVTKAGSRDGDRTPGLSDFAKSILIAQLERHPDSDYIFSSNGKPLPENCLAQWLRRFCNTAGVKYRRPHCLRATAITMMSGAGVDRNRIQHASGHMNPEMTAHYIDASAADELTSEEANLVFPKPSGWVV